jgi:hypothetical protein
MVFLLSQSNAALLSIAVRTKQRAAAAARRLQAQAPRQQKSDRW